MPTDMFQSKFALYGFGIIIICILMIIIIVYMDTIPEISLIEIFSKRNISDTLKQKNKIKRVIDSDKFGITNYIWPEGIGLLCDIYDDPSTFLIGYIDKINNTKRFKNIENGDIIFLYGSQLNNFVDIILPNIIKNDIYFSLITAGHSDSAITSQLRLNKYRRDKIYSMLLKPKNLLFWFTQNYDSFWFKDSNINNKVFYKFIYKFNPIPLGFDFILSYLNPIFLKQRMGFKQNSFPNQQSMKIYKLLHDRDKIKLINDRENKIYLDFTLNIPKYLGDNKYKKCLHRYLENKNKFDTLSIYQEPSENNIYFRECPYRSYMYSELIGDGGGGDGGGDNIFIVSQQRIEQFKLFETRSKYKFLLSPLGNGFDCHRTWEGILFGMIIIAKTSPLDLLYKIHNLPVVIINDWNEINKTMLNIWYKKYKHLTYFENAETRYKMTNSYWNNYIKRVTLKQFDRMRYNNYSLMS